MSDSEQVVIIEKRVRSINFDFISFPTHNAQYVPFSPSTNGVHDRASTMVFSSFFFGFFCFSLFLLRLTIRIRASHASLDGHSHFCTGAHRAPCAIYNDSRHLLHVRAAHFQKPLSPTLPRERFGRCDYTSRSRRK